MARRKSRKTRPLVLYPRFTRPAPEYASIPIDVSSFKTVGPLSVTLEETEDLTTWGTPKGRATRRRRRRPAG